MKKLALLFLLLTVSLQAQLSFVSSNPTNGTTGVGLNDTLSITFSTALDTNSGVIFGQTFFSNINHNTEIWLSQDHHTVYLAPTLEDNKTYFILFFTAKAADSSRLTEPFLVEFTTAVEFPGYTVGGSVSFEDASISPRNTLVALLDSKPGNKEPNILFANIANEDGEFEIEHVANGTYYPIAIKDLNNDGNIDPNEGDVIARGDSIIVDNADVSGLDLFLKKIERVNFARAKTIIDSIKGGILFRNLKLYYVDAWNIDSTYKPNEWVFFFQNMMTQQLIKVEINPEGHRVEQLNNDFFNWVRSFRPLGDSLTFTSVPDSFIAKIERRFGKELRHRHLPDSLELQVQLSLGDIANGGFGQVVPDTTKFYWGLKYKIANRNRQHDKGEVALGKKTFVDAEDEEHLFIADYKTGEEVEVTGITKSNNNNSLKTFTLYQNYPNPFNPSTKISYTIPNAEHVTLQVYDILGNEVVALVNRNQTAGNYQVNFDASNLTSGIYFYQLRAGKFNQVQKMLLIK